MSEADEAYKEAQRLIAEALAGGGDKLNLDTDATHALTTLPPEIADLTGITRLYLNNTQITDLIPIAAMTEISRLYLDNTQVTDLIPIAAMTEITRLSLNNTQIKDLIPIAAMTEITRLYFNNTQVTDLIPITEMTEIARLYLNNTQVTDLTPIGGMTGITRLYLNNTQVTNLTPIVGMTGITRLYLNNTQVSDLTPIVGMTGITNLSLENTQVRDLRPLLFLTKLAEEPKYSGLTFRNTSANKLDPKLAELSAIEGPKLRATDTFAYLREVGDDWPPKHNDIPQIPAQIPAPLQAELSGGILVERPQPSDLPDATANRARQGWEALSEFYADVVQTLMKGNLPNLERAITAFGRALGDRFEDVRQIALGTHGQRIVEISKTASDTLMDDAAGDLRAFAAAIDTHLQRFPEWVAYLQDDIVETADTPPLGTVTDELRDLSQAFQDTDFIAVDLAQKFDELVQAAEDKDLPGELVKKGVLRSLSNMLSPIAERAVSAGKKVGNDLGKEVYKRAIQGVAISGVGSVAGILLTKGQILVMLAEKYPATLGWLQSVLRYLGL